MAAPQPPLFAACRDHAADEEIDVAMPRGTCMLGGTVHDLPLASRMTDKTIAINDIAISYAELGNGPPLVLLHGGLATAAMAWTDRYAQLAAKFHIFAPDSRGHGRTTNPSGHLGYDQMADDVAAFCAALGIVDPFILGYSDGGQIGIELGLRHPGLAKAMIMGGTMSHMTDEYVAGVRDWGFLSPDEVDVEKLQRQWGSFFDTLTRDHRGNGEPEYWRAMLVHIARLWLTVPTYSAEQLGSIATPTLVIAGDRDHVAGLDQATRLYKLLGKAELAIIPGVGHSASETDLFWSAVLDFLRRQV
jgi:pimeloyl-ACP methyl ester carboxylesterase